MFEDDGGRGAAVVVPGPNATSALEVALREFLDVADVWWTGADEGIGAVAVSPSVEVPTGSGLAVGLDAAPGLELASLLSSLDVADLDDHTVVEVLAAWERVAAWAQAGSTRALAELLERTRDTSGHEFVVDGVAARLGLSRHAAEQHVAVAHGTAHLPEVADALADGLVDRRKAEVLVSAGRLPDDQRRAAIRELLPDVEHLTAAQIRARMKRAEIQVDPGGTEKRHEAARRERFVRLEPVDDAMAYLTAYLPADDAARAFAAVQEAAFAMRGAPGEERRLDECRADVLVGMLCGRLTSDEDVLRPTSDEDGTEASGPRRRRAVGVHVTVAASTLLGADDLPATLAGYGPIPASMARMIASDPDAVWQRIFTDPGSGVLTDVSSRTYRPSPRLRAAVAARDTTCTFPGCRVPATGCDLDHVKPYDPSDDGPQTHGDNLHALCRTHHRAKTIGGWQVTRDPATGITRWVAPTGHRYVRPADAPVDRNVGRSRSDAARPNRRDDGPPPY